MADAFQDLEKQNVEPAAPGSQKNKTAIFFHLFFKVSTLVFYLFSTWFYFNFVMIFVVVVLMSAFDFWTVKNVTGRLLVGLRWWNEVKDDGTTIWIFESRPENSRPINTQDSIVFWASLYLTPFVWIFFAISSLLSKWLLVVSVPLILSCANLVGYWKCQSDAKKKLASFIVQQL
eukprot:TRINITY_DN2138_c0_g2_i1.p1 TRINITY_DN2138_c0_g2~~TRINITY_DN2138_c0_g2_i1.p1  ORF type:complete len:193 (+),score=49.17 TRINITY_DN2138_c0_g2_i1:57-581(+)